MSLNKKVKVLFVAPTPPPYTGLEVISELFLRSDIKKEFRIIHIRSNLNKTNQSRGKLGLYNTSRFMLLCLKVFIFEFIYRPKILYSILSENFTGFMRSSFIVLIGKLFRNRVVMHLHGANFRNFYFYSNRFLQIYVRFILQHADRIIVLGKSLRTQFSGICALDKIRVVPNGIPPAGEGYFAKCFEQKDREGKCTVLFLGLLSQAKGFNDMIKAMPLVLEAERGVRFIFAGERVKVERNILFSYEGKMLEREDVEALLPELENKYPQEICFSSVVEGKEKEKLFMGSDIFVLPSYSEGLPISIIEAMSYGLPIITSPVGALPDYLREGDNCFFVPPGDYVKLADSLIRLIRDPALRFEIGKRNYEYSRTQLSIEHSAKVLSEVIAQVSQ